MEPKNKWKTMPLLLKIFVLVLTAELVFELFNLAKFFIYFGYAFIPQIQSHIFGFGLSGIAALTTTVLINEIGKIVLLAGVWNRYKWVWGYGIVYLTFLVIKNIFPIFKDLSYLKTFIMDYLQKLDSFIISQNPGLVMNEGLKMTTNVIGVTVIVLTILLAFVRMTGLDILLLFIFFRKRGYFK